MVLKLAARILGTKAIDTDPTTEPDLRCTVFYDDDKHGLAAMVSVREDHRIVAEAEFAVRDLESFCEDTLKAIYAAREAKAKRIKPAGKGG